MIDTLRLTAEDAIGTARAQRGVGRRAARRIPRRDRASATASSTATCGRARSRTATGIPIALKDVISTKGIETTAGSRILEGYTPVFDSTVAARVKGAGLSRTRQDEHGRVRDGLVDRELGVGAVAQSRGIRRACRGARAAARLRPSRQVSRPGGSAPTRAARSSSRPRCAGTSDCGRRTGPSLGTAIVAFASSLDQIGPVAKTVRDVALLYSIIAGRDPLDSTTAELPEAVQLPEGDSLAGVRLAVPKQVGGLDAIEPGVRAVVRGSRSSERASSAPRWGSATSRSRTATGCRATTSSLRRRRRRTSRATTASATGRVSTGDDLRRDGRPHA